MFTRREVFASVRVCCLVLASAVALASRGSAQERPGETRLSGRVIRQTLEGERVVARNYAVLHRVSPTKAGPVDSMLTDDRGRFSFRFVPDSGALYLVSSQFGGIAYFSPPAGRDQPAATSDIIVYDTTSREVPLRLQGRHLVVSAPNTKGVRTLIDVLEIENDTILTRVAGANESPTFSVRLPDQANNARASQGDGSEAPLTMKDGRAELFNALSPGLRQIVITYELAASAFPVSLPLERSIGLFEALLEDTTATAAAPKVVSKGVVAVDGRSFARFLGQDVPPNAVVRITVPSAPIAARLPKWLLPLVLGVSAMLAAILLLRRPSPALADAPLTLVTAPGNALASTARTTSEVTSESEAVGLARAVATIDRLLAKPATRPADQSALTGYRDELRERLRLVLARRSRRS